MSQKPDNRGLLISKVNGGRGGAGEQVERSQHIAGGLVVCQLSWWRRCQTARALLRVTWEVGSFLFAFSSLLEGDSRP